MTTMIIVVRGSYTPDYRRINMETGAINECSQWIFEGFRHVKHRQDFIPRSQVTKQLVEDLFSTDKLFYANDKCQYAVVDNDHGTIREWGNRPIRIFFKED
jgi:hypothetical protein